jgi:breast cancer 2 susceptibility protein
MSPAFALYYSFHTRNSCLTESGSGEEKEVLGPSAALSELHKLGCALATKAWVDNHWALVLWKLAGMVALDPSRETGTDKRWCWGEVIRQLLYRSVSLQFGYSTLMGRIYERYHHELHAAKRPALRLITTQDASPSLPLVLCISNITWSEESEESSQPIFSRPELELTDGWYRLRAEIDAPLARAVRQGIIRVGRKLGIVGARVRLFFFHLLPIKRRLAFSYQLSGKTR